MRIRGRIVKIAFKYRDRGSSLSDRRPQGSSTCFHSRPICSFLEEDLPPRRYFRPDQARTPNSLSDSAQCQRYLQRECNIRPEVDLQGCTLISWWILGAP